MLSQYSKEKRIQALHTFQSIKETIDHIIDWNRNIKDAEYFYSSESGMQLLAANCMLITAIGEGINKINKLLPDFLESQFPGIPWKAVIGMRNHIAHGYFEIDADLVYEAVKQDIPILSQTISRAIILLNQI
jgi:uncharacterized protein with HEPN domain